MTHYYSTSGHGDIIKEEDHPSHCFDAQSPGRPGCGKVRCSLRIGAEHIVDLKKRLTDTIPEKVRRSVIVIVILDSCISGQVLNLAYKYNSDTGNWDKTGRKPDELRIYCFSGSNKYESAANVRQHRGRAPLDTARNPRTKDEEALLKKAMGEGYPHIDKLEGGLFQYILDHNIQTDQNSSLHDVWRNTTTDVECYESWYLMQSGKRSQPMLTCSRPDSYPKYTRWKDLCNPGRDLQNLFPHNLNVTVEGPIWIPTLREYTVDDFKNFVKTQDERMYTRNEGIFKVTPTAETTLPSVFMEKLQLSPEDAKGTIAENQETWETSLHIVGRDGKMKKKDFGIIKQIEPIEQNYYFIEFEKGNGKGHIVIKMDPSKAEKLNRIVWCQAQEVQFRMPKAPEPAVVDKEADKPRVPKCRCSIM